MPTSIKRLLIALALLGTLSLVLISQRHTLLVQALTVAGPVELLPPTEEGPNVRWHDDYFTVEALAEGVFAIGEPRYYQQNFSYLQGA